MGEITPHSNGLNEGCVIRLIAGAGQRTSGGLVTVSCGVCAGHYANHSPILNIVDWPLCSMLERWPTRQRSLDNCRETGRDEGANNGGEYRRVVCHVCGNESGRDTVGSVVSEVVPTGSNSSSLVPPTLFCLFMPNCPTSPLWHCGV